MSLRRRLLGSALAALLGAASAAPSRADEAPGPAAQEEAALRARLEAGPAPRDRATVLRWAADRAAEGRARRGTRLGGDLLSGAAAAVDDLAHDATGALRLWREAAAAYPAGAPHAGLAWLEIGACEARRGDAPTALAALDEAERVAAQPGRPDDAPDDAAVRARLVERLAGVGRTWRAEVLASLGRHAEAADLHEAAARAARRGADAAWERAAVAAWRAGHRERALAASAQAMAVARDEARASRLAAWRLWAAHGLLDARGEVRLAGVAPGDAFVEEARAFLRSIEGRRGAYEAALQAASYLLAGGRPRDAFEMYGRAFADPWFAAALAASPVERSRLVTGAWTALAAGEPQTALDWLLRAQRAQPAALVGAEALRLRIDEALAQREAAAGATAEDAPPEPAREPARRRSALVGLDEPPPPPHGPEAPVAEAEAPESEGDGSWPWLAGLGALALAAFARARLARPHGG